MASQSEVMAYLAGLFDGEGCITYKQRSQHRKGKPRAYKYWNIRIEINMIDKKRWYLNLDSLKDEIGNENKFSRKTWALLSLEIWQQQFHDKAQEYKKMIKQ